MWFKKKSVLVADHHYDTEKSFDGTDWRTTGKKRTWYASLTLPSIADAGNYFYLPALGFYYSGQLHYVGDSGYYWSSSAHPSFGSGTAYFLNFTNSGSVQVDYNYNNRNFGMRVEPTFE